MGYLFIFLSVISNTAKGACSKFVSEDISTAKQNIFFNLIRNLFCTAIAFVMVLLLDGGKSLAMKPIELLLSLFSGAAMAIFTFAWMFAVKSDAYMLVNSCNSASFVIPCVFGFALLGERITVCKLIAFFVIVAALYFLLKHNFKLKGKISLADAIMLLLIFFTTGTYQAMQKIYAVTVTDKDIAYYTFYTFAISAIILFLGTLFVKEKTPCEARGTVKKNFPFLIVMAVGNFASTYFQSLAAKTVDSIILYPVFNALILIAGGFASTVLFKEKFTKSCLVGLVLVFIALILSAY